MQLKKKNLKPFKSFLKTKFKKTKAIIIIKKVEEIAEEIAKEIAKQKIKVYMKF